MKTVFIFSGQGSQYYHMGSKLFEANSVFRKHMLALDEIVKAERGISVVDELYNKKYKMFDPFLSLRLTHPAIFMTGYALAKVLEQKGITADYVLGSSLGEFTAAALSGAMSEIEALKLIMNQAEIIEKNCQEGRMIAVLHELNVYNNIPDLKDNSVIAAINGPSQFVIAGECEKLAQAKKSMKANDILHQELMVSYGFHSPAIDPAGVPYKSYLTDKKFRTPLTPMISGVSGRQLNEIPDNYFWDVVRKPTAYRDAIEALESSAGKGEDLMYIDLGPSGSLANLIRYNIREGSRSRGFQIMSPFQQELKKLEEATQFFNEHKQTISVQVPKKNEPLVAYIFPGQGSQKKGMGAELFDSFPELTRKASEILGYSIKELCVENASRNLSLTEFTQPALYVVNALSYLQLQRETGIVPDFVAGHSLGEFNALFAAGGFDFETGLKLVQKRGALMAKMKGGGMAAVKGLSPEEIRDVIERNHLEEIDVANYNTQNQIVLSGPEKIIAKANPYFESAGATLYFPLNVSGAFHSRYMQPAKEEFEKFLNGFNFSPLKIPVVSNVEASFYADNKIKTLLAGQLVKPVRWTESISFLLKKGEVTFKEVGPGDVLTKIVWRIQQDLQEVIQ